MIHLQKMAPRQITSANYITSVNGMLHPDRTLAEHDFLYLMEGKWEVIEEGEMYQMESDDLLILAAGRHHWGEKMSNAGNRHMYFHVCPVSAEQQTAENMDKTEEELSAFPTIIHCGRNPAVRRYFQEIISSFWAKDGERENRLNLLFNLLLCELTLLTETKEKAGETDPFVEKIRRQISSNPQVFYTSREMAAECFICPRTLNNRFQRIYGKTFYAYQMDLKLEMVRQFLIHQPEAKLHEVALNYGFYDEFHLSKAFKKKFGQPPSRFRERNRAGKESRQEP